MKYSKNWKIKIDFLDKNVLLLYYRTQSNIWNTNLKSIDNYNGILGI